MNRIARIEIDDAGRVPPTPEIEQERKVAIFDLLEDNSFTPLPRGDQVLPEGPYALTLSIRDKRLVFDIATEAGAAAGAFHLSLGPFRQVVKDYFQIWKAYYEAVKSLPPAQIETIDMARRGIHNEGARVLMERLDGKAEIDLDTARRLFTLICVLGADPVSDGLPQSILFCCDHNAVRSPMAEGMMKKFYGERVYVQSAGVKSEMDVDGFAVSVCEEIGVPLHLHKSRSFDEMQDWGDDVGAYDLIVALSPASQRRVLDLTRFHHLDVEYWPVLDPTGLGTRRDEKLDAYRQTRNQIRERMLGRFGPPLPDEDYEGA